MFKQQPSLLTRSEISVGFSSSPELVKVIMIYLKERYMGSCISGAYLKGLYKFNWFRGQLLNTHFVKWLQTPYSRHSVARSVHQCKPLLPDLLCLIDTPSENLLSESCAGITFSRSMILSGMHKFPLHDFTTPSCSFLFFFSPPSVSLVSFAPFLTDTHTPNPSRASRAYCFIFGIKVKTDICLQIKLSPCSLKTCSCCSREGGVHISQT